MKHLFRPQQTRTTAKSSQRTAGRLAVQKLPRTNSKPLALPWSTSPCPVGLWRAAAGVLAVTRTTSCRELGDALTLRKLSANYGCSARTQAGNRADLHRFAGCPLSLDTSLLMSYSTFRNRAASAKRVSRRTPEISRPNSCEPRIAEGRCSEFAKNGSLEVHRLNVALIDRPANAKRPSPLHHQIAQEAHPPSGSRRAPHQRVAARAHRGPRSHLSI